MIVFEYPLNERIRTWLRVESLFDKVFFFMRSRDARSHHAALLALFELVDVMARPELRSELIQELERQKSTLEALHGNPAVDSGRLNAVLGRISAALGDLHLQAGKLGQHVRDNDWLATIKSRTGIPGGACGFDLPAYHFWLNMPAESRIEDLKTWLEPMMPIQAGIDILLKLLRESGNGGQQVAAGGIFQLMLGGRPAHLLRVGVPQDQDCVPEVSANKYAVNVRFVTVERSQKPRAYEQDVPFTLMLCSLSGCCVPP